MSRAFAALLLAWRVSGVGLALALSPHRDAPAAAALPGDALSLRRAFLAPHLGLDRCARLGHARRALRGLRDRRAPVAPRAPHRGRALSPAHRPGSARFGDPGELGLLQHLAHPAAL